MINLSKPNSRNAVPLLLLAVLSSACTKNESKFIDEALNGPMEIRELATAAMPVNQSALLRQFKEACSSYWNQQNDIQKSQVFRDAMNLYAGVGPVKEWTGTLRSVTTDQGGSTARLTILMGDSTISDADVQFGSEVYKSAGNLEVGQNVIFSGRNLADDNATEMGKVCKPNLKIKLTTLRRL